MTLSSTIETRKSLLTNSLLLIPLFSFLLFIVFSNITYAAVDNASSSKGSNDFLALLNGPFVSAVLSTVVVSVIAYLAGRLRSVSLKLQVIPSLQENQVDIKKNMADIKEMAEKNNTALREQLDHNSNELKKQLEKMDEKVDKRFDTVSDLQRVIEKDMNEKVMNLLYTMRNYTNDRPAFSSNNSSSRNSSNNDDRYNVKYKE
jgi:FtsZ-binding cell division protein ZapB